MQIDAGPGISKLVMMENIHVDVAKYGDRLDHISAIGRVKRRIEIMHALPGNPFVIVLNLQIPGDPPCSIVFYFIVPLSFYPGKSDTDGLNPARELFKKFIDFPLSPVITENEKFLAECLEESMSLANNAETIASDNKGSSGGALGRAKTMGGGGGGGSGSKGLSRSATTVGGASGGRGVARTKSSFFAQPAVKSWTRCAF